jgi:hypothetical protein
MTETCFDATEIDVGFHPEGYRIDKTASPMNRYTKWEILPGNRWAHPTPVCFHALPPSGWIKKDRFDWDKGSVEGIG